MRHACIAFVVGSFILVGCSTPGLQVPMGEDAVLSPDGLHRVEGTRSGTLFIRPNYTFGSYTAFTLGPTAVTFKQGSRVLNEKDVKSLIGSFESVARSAIGGTGRKEASERGRCVAVVNLGLVDLDLLPPEKVRGPTSSGLRTIGAVTLVLEIRDGHTNESLLRFGQREILEHSSADISGNALVGVFERFERLFQKDFQRSVSRLEPAMPAMPCEERAGKS